VDFVDNFARRAAGWDRYAIASAKNLINKRTGFPTVEEQQESFQASIKALSQKTVVSRLNATITAGLQSNETFEIYAPQEIRKFNGDGSSVF
jgi:hypothetical protein